MVLGPQYGAWEYKSGNQWVEIGMYLLTITPTWGIVCVSLLSTFRFCESRDLIPRGDAFTRDHSKDPIKLKLCLLSSHFDFFVPRD